MFVVYEVFISILVNNKGIFNLELIHKSTKHLMILYTCKFLI